MKSLLPLFAGILRAIADSLEKREEHEDADNVVTEIDVMADVDDQRAHHFGAPQVLDDSYR